MVEGGAPGGCCPSVAATPRASAMSAATGMPTPALRRTLPFTPPSASESAKGGIIMDREFYESEIRACKQLLGNTDYVTLKIAEGAATTEEYAEMLAKRAQWRVRINELEELLGQLND